MRSSEWQEAAQKNRRSCLLILNLSKRLFGRAAIETRVLVPTHVGMMASDYRRVLKHAARDQTAVRRDLTPAVGRAVPLETGLHDRGICIKESVVIGETAGCKDPFLAGDTATFNRGKYVGGHALEKKNHSALLMLCVGLKVILS